MSSRPDGAGPLDRRIGKFTLRPTGLSVNIPELFSGQLTEEIIMIEAGASAPDFKLKSHDGEEVSLSQYRGKWVVLHSYPLAFTGG